VGWLALRNVESASALPSEVPAETATLPICEFVKIGVHCA
jgi:hypothetical protein